ncbi:MAG: PSD1 domain-containing protein [Verrucomicrobiales bacterium]|nr:PSD1 domain-containing protein [Verrucomicrobiales bacterium]
MLARRMARLSLQLIPCSLILAVTLGTGAAVSWAGEMTPEQRTFFENKIRPALVEHCYECHSVGAKKIGGKLLLDSPAEMLGGGESGPALVPGVPDESLIIQALRYDGVEMPPDQPLPEPVVRDFETWVKLGAPDPRENSPATAAAPSAIDPAALWAWQPVENPRPPAVREEAWPRGEIDSWILARLEAEQLTPAPDADARTLVRRLSFDLTGLPPAPEQVKAVAEGQLSIPDLVDALLASPHYGERWGRHWLDVARYAESNGNDGLSRNPSFPHAWRYRDYVIASFNDDVPFDRFIREQLAGDLLPASSPSQRDRQLIATGFLAVGAKPAKAMNDNFDLDVVADQIHVVGQGLLGMTVGCARCHDHKTDPISTREYYGLAGIFKSTETLWGAAAQQKLSAPQTDLHQLKAAPPSPPRPELSTVFASYTPRRAQEKAAFPHAPDAALAMGVREAKKIADSVIHVGGETKRTGPVAPRSVLEACAVPDLTPPVFSPENSGRLELARWISDPRNPLTARVMVNRIWLHLLGRGLVPTPDDFGATGERPSHPELLDHLATRFVTEGWSVKRLIRAIVLSRTYQLASTDRMEKDEARADRLRTLFGQHLRRRLDAEALRDAVLATTGALDPQPERGSLIQQRDFLVNELPPLHQPSRHRSVYLLMLRNSMPPELTPFNLPDGTAVTGQRDESTLATQALFLLNNAFMREQAAQLASDLPGRPEVTDLTAVKARLAQAYARAFQRSPLEDEVERDVGFLKEIDLTLVSSIPSASARHARAWEIYGQALLSSNEFRYVD